MTWFTGIAVYVVVWWIVLFMVLPWGAAPVDMPEPGHAESAPARPRLWLKAGVTTLIAAAIWGALYWAIANGLVSFRGAP